MVNVKTKKTDSELKPSLLIVDDEPLVRKSLARILTKEGYEVRTVDSGAKVFKNDLLSKTDVILLDLFLGKESGFDVLEKVREIAPHVVVIVVTGHGDVRSAVEAMKKGAYQFIEKPSDKKTIVDIVSRATYKDIPQDGKQKLQKITISIGRRREQFFYGEAFEPTIKLARKAAKGGNSTILIQGQSGTGKELLARYIHNQSSRKDKPFVAINCATLPKELIESELFGYESGAFTGARLKGKVGFVGQAEGGTLLLDEVGELPTELQTKFLRFLETKEYYQLGSAQLQYSDVRIMASTNADLAARVKEKKFRKDLFYRLNVVHLNIPPLADRKDEILPLAEYFLEYFNRKYNNHIKGFKERVKAYLRALPWDGNVRELKNLVERAIIISSSNYITFEDVDTQISSKEFDIIKMDINLDLLNNENPLWEARKEVISKVLELTNGNKSKAAKLLKIPRSTLRFYLNKGSAGQE
ncbi:MAG: sigma-54-dependent Fis family transcriptional regulator [Candidatus Marinimicrobia bacterium]|nr:sigma-54-dependent Fis family transcriptional regulator [Candidatus Neomarinimicrobiota bacterium]